MPWILATRNDLTIPEFLIAAGWVYQIYRLHHKYPEYNAETTYD